MGFKKVNFWRVEIETINFLYEMHFYNKKLKKYMKLLINESYVNIMNSCMCIHSEHGEKKLHISCTIHRRW